MLAEFGRLAFPADTYDLDWRAALEADPGLPCRGMELAERCAYFDDPVRFKQMVGAITFDSVAAAVNVQQPVCRPKNYGLVPIVPLKAVDRKANIVEHAGFSIALPRGVTSTYPAISSKKPYLDNSHAIGLTYRLPSCKDITSMRIRGRWLIAVAGGGVTSDGDVLVNQLQAVTGLSGCHAKRGGEFYKTGLYNNLDWKQTLVTAWARLAGSLAAPRIIVQSNANNTWDKARDAKVKHYDKTAQALGFQLNDKGNWQLEL